MRPGRTLVLATAAVCMAQGPALATPLGGLYVQPTRDQYRKRSGIESTNAEAKGRHGLGNLRVRGGPKVALLAKPKALAINTKRAVMYCVSELAGGETAPCPK